MNESFLLYPKARSPLTTPISSASSTNTLVENNPFSDVYEFQNKSFDSAYPLDTCTSFTSVTFGSRSFFVADDLEFTSSFFELEEPIAPIYPSDLADFERSFAIEFDESHSFLCATDSPALDQSFAIQAAVEDSIHAFVRPSNPVGQALDYTLDESSSFVSVVEFSAFVQDGFVRPTNSLARALEDTFGEEESEESRCFVRPGNPVGAWCSFYSDMSSVPALEFSASDHSDSDMDSDDENDNKYIQLNDQDSHYGQPLSTTRSPFTILASNPVAAIPIRPTSAVPVESSPVKNVNNSANGIRKVVQWVRERCVGQ
ncbi:hypothetical protein JAAARDRAFT_197405 [Jaapia argillacea MUCL 33604]|uniref:Uncharacterized protein n=1 Tax=Jaapia argillacea MUCL 33604 TaxID=933084 RepID=A0A067PIE4_9AGAM|nr:hypothetical protein JAAARDRAFT_197405 [Jaapia argillacea MUCL 33604]